MELGQVADDRGVDSVSKFRYLYPTAMCHIGLVRSKKEVK